MAKKNKNERLININIIFDSIHMLYFFLRHIEVKHEEDGTTTYTYSPEYLSPDRIEPLEVSFPDVKNAWEVLTAVSFGNFNKCPATNVIVEKSKYWYEKYGAEITEISHDSIKYSIPDSLDLQKANELKDEMLQFAPDSISFDESETDFAKNIIKDKYFYLWWD